MRDFLSNRPKLDGDLPASTPAPPPPAGLGALAGHALPSAAGLANGTNGCASDAPQVDLAYDAEGRVQEIRVTCRCGERITLRCTY